MNRDQFLDALGSAGESMIQETDRLRMTMAEENASPKLTVITKTRRPARRKMMFILAACMILMLSTVAAYATGLIGNRGGKVTVTNKPEGSAIMVFEPNEDMRIPYSLITGDIRNCTQYMRDQWTKNPDTGEYEWTGPSDAAHSSTPGVGSYSQSFNSLEEAAEYIGFEKLTIPAISEDASPNAVSLLTLGYAENLGDPGPDPEYRISFIMVTADYTIDHVIVHTSTYIITDAFENPRAITETQITTDDNGTITLTSETVTENNREFRIVHEDITRPEDYNGPVVEKRYFDNYCWAEDKVEYHLEINYLDFDRETVDRITNTWMNSFPN